MFKAKNMTQASFEAPEANSKKRKRHRETLSCLPCRDRKVACDREQPCSSCVRHKRAQDCVFVSDSHTKSKEQSPADNNASPPVIRSPPQPTRNGETLDERIARMEKAVDDIGKSRSFTGVNGGATQASTIQPPPDAVNTANTAERQSLERNIFAQGRLASKSSAATFYVGSAAWSIPVPYNAFYEGNFIEHKLWARLRRFHAAVTAVKEQIENHETIMHIGVPQGDQVPLLNLLPCDAICSILVLRYLDSVNQIYPIVPRAAFHEELKQFYRDRSAASEGWLALLGGIVAIGYYITILPFPDGSFIPDRAKLVELSTIAQQMAFSAASKTHRPPMVVFQALLIAIINKRLQFQWIDSNDSLSSLLGVAQRLCFSMGLHRDPRLAKNALQQDDAILREKLFCTYLILEFQHSLESGIPFLLRPSDFDVRNPGGFGSLRDKHLCEFMRAFPALAAGLQLTHSNATKPRPGEVNKILHQLQAATKNSVHVASSSDGPEIEAVRRLQAAFVPTLANRLHVALLNVLLEHGTPAIRQQVTTDMYKPPLAILDQLNDLMETAEKEQEPDVRSALQKIIWSATRSASFNAGSYLLCFLKAALCDQTLLTLRGPPSMAHESSFIFRKLRALVDWAAKTFDWGSYQPIKETGGFNAYLYAVEALYRVYVETGSCDPDLMSENGAVVVDAMGSGIEDIYERAGLRIGPGENPVVALPKSLGGRKISQTTSTPDFMLNDLDPLFFEQWDWPWQDLIPNSETSWSTPANQSLSDGTMNGYEMGQG